MVENGVCCVWVLVSCDEIRDVSADLTGVSAAEDVYCVGGVVGVEWVSPYSRNSVVEC